MSDTATAPKVEIHGPMGEGYDAILTPEALALVGELETRFGARRRALLAKRVERQAELDAGGLPGFRPEHDEIRQADWTIARPAPADLQDRRVEITGPVDRKMIINALNSGAKCFMADFEDASSPSWSNMIEGQINLRDAVRRDISFTDPKSGKAYALNDDIATLIVRARGWHLEEAHLTVDGQPVSGGITDFALYLFHNHAELKARGTGPYFYLPKLETAEEAALWADVITAAEDHLGLERGTVRCTVLVETIMATFELDAILHALREWIVALNCGRWDYIFSYIKRLRTKSDRILPDRGQVTMTVPFMRAYSKLVIETCHRRGAHAMGGMSAFIPVKGDEAANEKAFAQLTADKTREATDGHDGTWVAHPGMVAAAMAVFDEHMPGPNQVDKRTGFTATAEDLLAEPDGEITPEGVRGNISVAIQYVASWLRGQGAAPINNLMEDAATAEIARAQLWQWRTHAAKDRDGVVIDEDYVATAFDIEETALKERFGEDYVDGQFAVAAEIVRELAFEGELTEFLTLPAYERLKQT